MNIYIPKIQKDIFLEKLKEIPIVDDYILDRERLGKEKIKIITKNHAADVISALVGVLPVDAMIVDQVEYPGSDYILCVGEIQTEHMEYLKQKQVFFSIVTKKEGTIRFNAWIHFSQLESVYQSGNVFHFSSINGRIKEETLFVIEGNADDINETHHIIADFSDAYIIKGKKLYVKLLMHQFTKVYELLRLKGVKIEIIDDGVL